MARQAMRVEQPVSRSNADRRMRWLKLAIGLAALLLLGCGLRMDAIHDQTRDWSLIQPAAPTRLVHAGNDYLRGSVVSPTTQPLGRTVPDGTTAGGGQILIPIADTTGRLALTALIVKDGNTEYLYTEMGGG